MSARNPHLNNVERAPYEVLSLVTKLGETRLDRSMTDDQRQMAEAIAQHTLNATDVILSGIDAIGRILSCAVLNEQWQPSMTNLNDLGALISHLAVEAQAMHETRNDIITTIEHHTKSTKGARA